MAKAWLSRWQARCRIGSNLGRELFCEFAATTLLTYIGLSVEAQQLLSGWLPSTHLPNALGWGLALVFAVQLAQPVSGAHLNPAISFVAWTSGALSFGRFLLYSLAQTAAGFVGAALVFLLYLEKIYAFEGGRLSVHGPNATAAVFATFPGAHLSVYGAMVDQVSCTALLAFIVALIADERLGIPRVAQPAMMGAMLTVVCMGFALNASNAMNPARDLGPRLFALTVGYGWEVFSYNGYCWFWVPVVCPPAGALAGWWLYVLVVAPQLPEA